MAEIKCEIWKEISENWRAASPLMLQTIAKRTHSPISPEGQIFNKYVKYTNR